MIWEKQEDSCRELTSFRRRAAFCCCFSNPFRQGRFSFNLLKFSLLFDSNDVFVFIIHNSEFVHIRFNKIAPH